DKMLLIATDDATSIFIAQHADRLEKHFVFPRNPIDVVWSLYNKREMYFLAKHLNIPTAETAFPESRKDVLQFCRKARFPVMLKASDNIRTARRTGKKMAIIASKDELLAEYDSMEDGSNPSLMIQEYIPGRDNSVWMFNGYFDERSECLFGMTAQKLHQTPV